MTDYSVWIYAMLAVGGLDHSSCCLHSLSAKRFAISEEKIIAHRKRRSPVVMLGAFLIVVFKFIGSGVSMSCVESCKKLFAMQSVYTKWLNRSSGQPFERCDLKTVTR
jgi:hypothetical protein